MIGSDETAQAPATGSTRPWKRAIGETLKQVFAVDLRSLAIFRVALGLLILIDLVQRATDLAAHYTDSGVLPRSALSGFHLSIHRLSGSVAGQSIWFLCSAAFAAALVVGYRTRLATVGAWYWMLSLHQRNPLVLHGADDLVRLLLFWSMFLPLGARFSLDQVRNPRARDESGRVFTIAGVALLLQVALVYWVTAVLKSHPAWWRDGTAVYYALQLDQLSTPLGQALLDYPGLMRFLTYATLLVEIAGPVAAFSPFYTVPIRIVVLCLFALLHLGFALCLELGLYPYVAMIAWLPFVPAGVWKFFTRDRGRRGQVPAPPGERAQLGGKFDPAVRSEEPEQRMPQQPSRVMAQLRTVVAGLCLVYVVLWNLRVVSYSTFVRVLPEWTDGIGNALMLKQNWNMFAPRPPTDDGWYVVAGALENGTEVDLFQKGALSWAKPEPVAAAYRNDRWREYLLNLWKVSYAAHRLLFLDYLRTDWNGHEPPARRVKRVRLYFMREDTLPGGRESRPRRVLLAVWRDDEAYVFPTGRAPYAPVAHVLELLSSASPGTREGAATLLARETAGAATVVPALGAVLDDGDFRVRRAAAIALGELASPRSVELLVQALGDEHWLVRAAAAESLGQLGEAARRALPPIRSVLEDSDPDVRAAASWAIGQIEQSAE